MATDDRRKTYNLGKLRPKLGCPKCGGMLSKVVRTTGDPQYRQVNRERSCSHCGHVYHTKEIIR